MGKANKAGAAVQGQQRAPSAASLVAVHEGGSTAGLIAWWQLGGQIELERLTQAWGAAGFDEEQLPNPPSELVALRRAIKALYPKLEVVPLPKTSGFAVGDMEFEEVEGEKPDPVFRMQFKAWMDDGAFRVAGPRSTFEMKRILWKELQKAQGILEATDLSTWLVKQASSFGAVALRTMGGVYFLPETRVEEWRKLASCIEGCSKSVLYEIPAMRTEKAVSAILAALRNEVEAEVQHMEAALLEGEMGVRALANRQEYVKALLNKVGQYERLLGANLQAISNAVEAVQDKITQAMLAKEE